MIVSSSIFVLLVTLVFMIGACFQLLMLPYVPLLVAPVSDLDLESYETNIIIFHSAAVT